MKQTDYIKIYNWMRCIKCGVQRELYALLYSLGGKKEGASCTIQYLADRLNITSRWVQKTLIELQQDGYVTVEYVAGKRSIFHTTTPEQSFTPEQSDTPEQSFTTTPEQSFTPDTLLLSDKRIQIKDNRENKEAASKKSKFQKPTIEQIAAYCQERQNGIDAEAFFYFYESKGWLVGKTPMKDWQAAVRTWEQKRKNETQYGNNNPRQAATTVANTTEAKPYSRIQQLGDTHFNLK